MLKILHKHIVGLMFSVLVSSVIYHWIKPRTIKLVSVAFPLSTWHKEVRAKMGWARNQDIVFEWSDMSTHRLLFQ